jgi:beta-xylosidase
VRTLLLLALALPVLAPAAERPRIVKRGTVDLDMVECTPIVFEGRLYRSEWVRKNYWDNHTGENYSRFVDYSTGETTPPFAHGFVFSSAFVDNGTVYVTATGGKGKTVGADQVHMFASRDLKHWDTWVALDLPGFSIFNTSICKAGKQYVLMFEIDKPKEEAGVPFTARFATSPDLKRWTLTTPEHNYAKDRFTAPHCLRYLDGYFYNFYVGIHDGYETYVVRSRDLITWEPSPLNPVLRASDEDRQIANPRLTAAQRQRVATAVNRNNSDIDFCEFNGRLIISYCWGNQTGVEHLAEAYYEGTEASFLKAWFPPQSRERQ